MGSHLIKKIRVRTKKVFNFLIQNLTPNYWKEKNELNYWKERKNKEGTLSNDHYEYFYTTHFGIKKSYYNNKVILDIGCGPRGSLEWAFRAKRRIGLDPLAKEYLSLGANNHKMEYFDSPSENIPLKKEECDAVFSFNSLDHVQNVEKTITEIKRVTRPGGIFLLLIEVNHPPTACEPHQLNVRQIIEALSPEFSDENLVMYRPVHHGMYQSVHANETINNPLDSKEIGYLSGKFIRR